jgi:hypothetical protein
MTQECMERVREAYEAMNNREFSRQRKSRFPFGVRPSPFIRIRSASNSRKVLTQALT